MQAPGRLLEEFSMIYVVEDDANIRELERYALQSNGYSAKGFENGASFWAAMRDRIPNLIILDVMLPDEDGYRILARLRRTEAIQTIPVIMVTAKTSEIDVVKGLDYGADDYLCKPFGIMEFISRVKAVLRRAKDAPFQAPDLLYYGSITQDVSTRTVTVDGEWVNLTYKEFQVLQFFLEHPEEAISRDRIMKAVWGVDEMLETRTIDMHVRSLRQKLGEAGNDIRTVRKVGYILSARKNDGTEDA